MLLKNEDFADASVYLRVLEKRMLNNDSVNRIADASGVSETLRLIAQNSEYEFSSLKRTADYEDVLKETQKKLYETLYKLSKSKEIIDILSLKYDFHNLKTALKAKFLGIDAAGVYSAAGTFSVAAMKNYLTEKKRASDLPDFIYDAADAVLKAFEDNSDPQEIDILLDRQLFARMISLCEEVKNEFITEYVRLSIDFYNIKTLMRVKNMQKGTRFLGECLVPGGKAEKSFLLENYDKSPETLAQVFYYKYFGDTVKKGMESYAKTGNFSYLEKLF
ncbi:MAG: DUF2764 family protein, partial [Clostridiales bacterium]|nr:DUF2764 family protein [Clostridiales bacterium]